MFDRIIVDLLVRYCLEPQDKKSLASVCSGLASYLMGVPYDKLISTAQDKVDSFDDIRNNAVSATMSPDFDSEIEAKDAERLLNLKVLHLGYIFNKKIFSVPRNLVDLHFSLKYSQPLPNLSNTRIEVIVFGDHFNHPVSYLLPDTLRHLTFGRDFNQSVSHLPGKLVSLSFGDKFNQPIDNLPDNLRELSISSRKFDQKIKDLPDTLKTLIVLGYSWSGKTRLPDNLLDLYIDTTECEDGVSLDHLKLPDSLQSLEIVGDITELPNIPDNLISLILPDKYNQPLSLEHTKLVYLKTGFSFNQELDNLSDTLETLILGWSYDKSLDYLPESLIHLETGYCFNRPIDYLPDNLQVLALGDRFDQPINNLPISLLQLSLGFSFDQEVDNLPPELEILDFGHNFNQSIDNLPDTIVDMTLGQMFDQQRYKIPYDLEVLRVKLSNRHKIKNAPEWLEILTY